jgi:hypothetical protein
MKEKPQSLWKTILCATLLGSTRTAAEARVHATTARE